MRKTITKVSFAYFSFQRKVGREFLSKNCACADFSLRFYKVYYVYFSFQTKWRHKKIRASQIKSGTKKYRINESAERL